MIQPLVGRVARSRRGRYTVQRQGGSERQGVQADEEQRGAQVRRGDPIALGVRNAFDEVAEAQAAQIIADRADPPNAGSNGPTNTSRDVTRSACSDDRE